MEESSKINIKCFLSEIQKDEISIIINNIKVLQKSFLVEVDNNFINLKGKENIFNIFISNKLNDLAFVVSGTFSTFSREELEEKIKLNGGRVSKSLSSKTNFLIFGDNMGPKKKIKAVELNIKMISENEFISMI